MFGEMHQYKKERKIVYTVEINGFEPPVFIKDGVKMTDEEIDSDLYISRPYREDNGCIFCVGSKNKFLDYGEFLPLYFSRLTEYSPAFKDVLENRNVYCDEEFLSVGFTRGKPTFFKRKSKNHSYKPCKEVCDYDRTIGEYAIFLQLLEMVNYHRQFKSENGIVGVPIIVDGLLSRIHATSFNVRFLMSRTREMARQTFFVEKRPEEFERLVR